MQPLLPRPPQAYCRAPFVLAQEAKLVDTFKTGGMIVNAPDVESFRKPVLASLPAKFEAKWGKGLWERVAAA